MAIRIDINEYHFVLDNGRLTSQRYTEAKREIWDKSIIALFLHAVKLEENLVDTYNSDDLPDLLGSNEHLEEDHVQADRR